MLLAIDIGNTHSVYGLWDGKRWLASWRRSTDRSETEDELASWLHSLFAMKGLPFEINGVICASVVPALTPAIQSLGRALNCPVQFLRNGAEVGLKVRYDPPHSVGADRLANALGALARFAPPLVVVDFGTATTFDVIDKKGAYIGGAIWPGVQVAGEALAGRTSQLPQVELRLSERAVGRSTVESLQSGLMHGYIGGIDALIRKIVEELGGSAKVVATGGLGETFVELCEGIEEYLPTLTLEGLLIAHARLQGER